VAVARAQLLGPGRLSAGERVWAYRVVRTVSPRAYTDGLVSALISMNYEAGENWELRVALCAEAVEAAREASRDDVRDARLLVEALTAYQPALAGAGRRAEALEACRELAEAGRRSHQAGHAATPSGASQSLARMLAEEGRHAEAAALFEEILLDNRRAQQPERDFWTAIAWIAETEAAGDHGAARGALQALIDQDRARAEQETGPYAFVVWELLLLAALDHEHGREQEAAACDAATEGVLTLLAADGEPKNWSNILAWWVVLAGLTGRTQDRPVPGDPQPPLFADLHWSPDVIQAYLGPGRDSLQSEAVRLAALAEHDPAAHLGRLVQVQRAFTLRSVRYWARRSWRITDELRRCFDEGVDLSRRLAAVHEEAGRSALARALADRAGMHVAARDFPPALHDFTEARQCARGGPGASAGPPREASC
jgi:hypothetical protein